MSVDIMLEVITKVSEDEAKRIEREVVTRRNLASLIAADETGLGVIFNQAYYDDDGTPDSRFDDLRPFLTEISVLGGSYNYEAMKADNIIPENGIVIPMGIAYDDADEDCEKPMIKFIIETRKGGLPFNDDEFNAEEIETRYVVVPLDVMDEKYVIYSPEPAFLFRFNDAIRFGANRREVYNAVAEKVGLEPYNGVIELRYIAVTPEILDIILETTDLEPEDIPALKDGEGLFLCQW